MENKKRYYEELIEKIISFIEKENKEHKFVSIKDIIQHTGAQRVTIDKILLLLIYGGVIGFYEIGKARGYFIKDKSKLKEVLQKIKETGVDRFFR